MSKLDSRLNITMEYNDVLHFSCYYIQMSVTMIRMRDEKGFGSMYKINILDGLTEAEYVFR